MSNSSRPHGLCPPGSSILGIFQARILEWVAIPFSRGSSWPRSPALQADSLPFELPGKPLHIVADCIFQKWSHRYMSHPTCYDVAYSSIERWNLCSHPLKLFICLYLCWLTESVQFSCSVMSDSLRPHGLQHARLPCPSPTPGAYSNSCSSHRWCHPTISSTEYSGRNMELSSPGYKR